MGGRVSPGVVRHHGGCHPLSLASVPLPSPPCMQVGPLELGVWVCVAGVGVCVYARSRVWGRMCVRACTCSGGVSLHMALICADTVKSENMNCILCTANGCDQSSAPHPAPLTKVILQAPGRAQRDGVHRVRTLLCPREQGGA